VLTYSVTHRANIAHGAVFAFAGQILVLAATIGYTTLWMTLPAAIAFGMGLSALASAAVMVLLARVVFPPIITQSPNQMITATLAVSIVLMESARLAADTKDHWLPPLLASRFYLWSGETAPAKIGRAHV
jgi:branched-chain amino acid transport system permease protein